MPNNTVDKRALVGRSVCHTINGIGRIEEYDEQQDLFTVTLGLPHDGSNEQLKAGEFENRIQRAVARRFNDGRRDDVMTVKIRSSRFLDNEAWFLPPDHNGMELIRKRLRTGPKNPKTIKKGKGFISRAHQAVNNHLKECRNAEIVLDDMYRQVVKSITRTVDVEWGLYITRGVYRQETPKGYRIKLNEMQKELGKNAWSDHALIAAPVECQVHAINCLYQLAMLYSHVENTTVSAGIRELCGDLEDRLRITRSYLNTAMKQSKQGQNREKGQRHVESSSGRELRTRRRKTSGHAQQEREEPAEGRVRNRSDRDRPDPGAEARRNV